MESHPNPEIAEGYGAPIRKGERILVLDRETAWRIRSHGEEGYPYEICGALLGHADASGRRVTRALPIENSRGEKRETRYVISSENILAVEKECARLGLKLLGFYHSHPDHPAKPSEYDREHAWPWYSYVIVSVAKGKSADLTAWQLEDGRAFFYSERLEVIG